MTSRERFFAAMNYQGFDRPPTHHYAVNEVNEALMKALGVSDEDALRDRLGDDFRKIEPRYIGPELRKFEDGSWEGLWGERYKYVEIEGGRYAESCYMPFANVEDVRELRDYRFPSADLYDYSKVKADCEKYPDHVRIIGGTSDPDCINGLARCRGVEQVLMDLATEDEVFQTLVEKRFRFVYEKNERMLEAANGMIDLVCFGEDLGDQRTLIMRPETYDRILAPYMEKLFAQAHRYGARTMMHSCGSVWRLIPRLIELGLDILEVIQVDAEQMEIERLHEQFYGKIAFCGSVSVQSTLPFGTTEDVREAVRVRKRLFEKGGMIIAPTHKIQVDTKLENILAMYEEIGSYKGTAE